LELDLHVANPVLFLNACMGIENYSVNLYPIKFYQ
jgi:hypothetical protein